MPRPSRSKRVLLVASAGGHWTQLMRLREAWEDCDPVYLTTDSGCRVDTGSARLYVVNDANQWSRCALIVMALRVAMIVLYVRPRVVVSTGAAPGYIAIRIARLIGAKCAWIDSMANVDELSLSGKLAGKWSDLWLTQWPQLARDEGPLYKGSVL